MLMSYSRLVVSLEMEDRLISKKCERFGGEDGLRGSRSGLASGRGEMGVRVQALTEFVEDRRDELRCDEAIGREERFEEMVARQARFMFQVAFGLLRNRQDAEDAVQEAFEAVPHGWLVADGEREGFSGADGVEGGDGPPATSIGEDVGCVGDSANGARWISGAECGGWR